MNTSKNKGLKVQIIYLTKVGDMAYYPFRGHKAYFFFDLPEGAEARI